jgi:hypothetical protein
MDWPEVFGACLLAHLTGDFLLQTDWQAEHKHGGLGREGVARRALFSHVLVYTLAFVPVFVWVGAEHSPPLALAFAALVSIPHLIVDDGRLLDAYIRVVKRAPGEVPLVVYIGVDQSVHVLCLAAVALLALG